MIMGKKDVEYPISEEIIIIQMGKKNGKKNIASESIEKMVVKLQRRCTNCRKKIKIGMPYYIPPQGITQTVCTALTQYLHNDYTKNTILMTVI